MLGNYLQRKRNLYPLFLAACIAAAAMSVSAEETAPLESTKPLETVTVTAERFPVKEKESPRFVVVLSSEELDETGANNLTDALRRIGGFAYKAFAPLGISHGGMNSSLAIRGLPDEELVLINGSPIQGAAGHAYDLNTIPLDQIERIEILKGAASTLYGADAMTGVINIITKKTGDETAVRAAVEFGSESYHNHGLSAMLPGVNFGLNYQYLGDQTEISRSFSKKYRYDLDETEKFAWNLNLNPLNHLYLDYLGSYYTTGFKKVFDADKPFEATDQEHYKNFANLRYETESFKAKAFGVYDLMRREEYTEPEEPEDENKNYNYGLEADYRFELSDWRFNIGADWVYRAADYNNQYGKQHRDDYAAFVQIKKSFFERLTATLGAREQFIDGAAGAKDYDRFLPSFGLSYKASENTNLFANSGKAFRAPSFNNQYYDSSFLKGNPNLSPEEGWTYEAGVKYDNNLLSLRLSAFYMSYEDKIEIDRSQGYPLSYFNAGEYDSAGIEWDMGINPFINKNNWLQNLSLFSNGYWAEPNAEDPDGEDYQDGPKLQTGLGIAYLSEPMRLNLSCQILTERERELESYAAVNFFGKFKLGKGYLTLSADNLFDEEVQVSGDLTQDASSQYVYYGLGQMVKLGYEIRF